MVSRESFVQVPKRRGIEIQAEPWHYRWDKPHHPRRCLLCRLERLAVRLGFAHYEPDEVGA